MYLIDMTKLKDIERFFEYSYDPEFNGPFSLELNPFCATSAIGSAVFCLGGDCDITDCDGDGACHSLRYCDFSQRVPLWKITKPLPCHRFYPIMATVDEKLYVFEEMGIFEDRGSPLGLLFDPVEECCKEVPFATFHKEGFHDLLIASVSRKLMVLGKAPVGTQYYYDIENLSWIPFHVHGLLDHVSGIRGQPIAVTEKNTLYWFNERREIRAFNWENLRMFKGPIIGFGHDCPSMQVHPYFSLTLLHLKDELFCIIWSGISDRLHLTFLRICLHNVPDTLTDSPHLLTASVVACFCYHLDFQAIVNTAHILCQGSNMQKSKRVSRSGI